MTAQVSPTPEAPPKKWRKQISSRNPPTATRNVVQHPSAQETRVCALNQASLSSPTSPDRQPFQESSHVETVSQVEVQAVPSPDPPCQNINRPVSRSQPQVGPSAGANQDVPLDVDTALIFAELGQMIDARLEPLREQIEVLSQRVNAMILFLVRWTGHFGRLPLVPNFFVRQPRPDGAGPSQVRTPMGPPPRNAPPLLRSPPPPH